MHILIIRPGAIGDTLLTLPVIQALREQYNSSSITLVGNIAVLPLAHACGIVEEFYDYQEACWSHLFLTESSRHMRDMRLDTIVKRTQLAICWLRDPDGIVERNLKAAGIQQVIVAPGRPDPSTSENTHITAYLAKTIGLTWQKPLRDIFLPLPDITQQEDKTGPVVLHPGSGGARKCWPVEHFAEVIYYLWQRNWAILVLAGPAEQERLVLLRSLLQAYPQPGRCSYLVDAPLLTIAQRLRQCQCYIGNDSGLTHLAGMLGLPTLALFGPSDPIIWCPPGPSVTVLYAQTLEQLDVETIITKLAALLS
jgi:ADP-heptose:LPS heptosyltransferase